MDTRLTELLPASLGIKNGDVKIIKSSKGRSLLHLPSVIRADGGDLRAWGCRVMIIGHTDCGAKHMNSSEMIEKMKERGIPQERIDMIRYCGINFESWLRGFETSEASVHETVDKFGIIRWFRRI